MKNKVVLLSGLNSISQIGPNLWLSPNVCMQSCWWQVSGICTVLWEGTGQKLLAATFINEWHDKRCSPCLNSLWRHHIFFYSANSGCSWKHEIQRKLIVTRSDRKSAHNAHNGERTTITTTFIGITFDNIFAHLHNLIEPANNIAKKSRKKSRKESRK